LGGGDVTFTQNTERKNSGKVKPQIIIFATRRKIKIERHKNVWNHQFTFERVTKYLWMILKIQYVEFKSDSLPCAAMLLSSPSFRLMSTM
jgi:hypothetical protein